MLNNKVIHTNTQNTGGHIEFHLHSGMPWDVSIPFLSCSFRNTWSVSLHGMLCWIRLWLLTLLCWTGVLHWKRTLFSADSECRRLGCLFEKRQCHVRPSDGEHVFSRKLPSCVAFLNTESVKWRGCTVSAFILGDLKLQVRRGSLFQMSCLPFEEVPVAGAEDMARSCGCVRYTHSCEAVQGKGKLCKSRGLCLIESWWREWYQFCP